MPRMLRKFQSVRVEAEHGHDIRNLGRSHAMIVGVLLGNKQFFLVKRRVAQGHLQSIESAGIPSMNCRVGATVSIAPVTISTVVVASVATAPSVTRVAHVPWLTVIRCSATVCSAISPLVWQTLNVADPQLHVACHVGEYCRAERDVHTSIVENGSSTVLTMSTAENFHDTYSVRSGIKSVHCQLSPDVIESLTIDGYNELSVIEEVQVKSGCSRISLA